MVETNPEKDLENVTEEILHAVEEKGAILTVTYSIHAVTIQLFVHGVTKEAIIEYSDARSSREYTFEMIRAVRMLLYSIDNV